MELHEVLRNLRKKAGLTQQEVAELMDASMSYVSQVERGERLPSWRYLVAFANRVGSDVVLILRSAGMLEQDQVDVNYEVAAILNEHPELASAFDYIRDYPHRIPEIIRYIRFLKGEDEEQERERDERPRRVRADQAASR